MSMIIPLLPKYAKDLGASPTVVGMIGKLDYNALCERYAVNLTYVAKCLLCKTISLPAFLQSKILAS